MNWEGYYLIPQAFTEHLLSAKPWGKHLGYSGEQDMIIILLQMCEANGEMAERQADKYNDVEIL